MIPAGAAVVIGVGNPYRADDGAGIEVACRLRERAPARVTIVEESGEGAALLEAWKSAAAVILIDAVRSGAPPGSILRLDARDAPLPRGLFHHSTHAFGVADAVELARALDQLPPRLILYGIEGASFAPGAALSPAVEQAAGAVVERILDDLKALLSGAG